MAGRITAALPTHPYLVCEEGGEVIGYAYAGAHAGRPAYRWSVNVSVYVDQRAHRRGVGQSLYRPLLRILSRQGFHSVFAGVTLPNDKSIGLHEALGFRPLGVYREVGFKHGQWHDVGWWRLGLRDGLPSTEPIPFAACHEGAESLIESTVVDYDATTNRRI